MSRVRNTTIDLILEMLIEEDGKIPWYLVDLYLYRTGECLYYAHHAADYAKVFYNSADNNFVVKTYFKGRCINKIITADPYMGDKTYYTTLEQAINAEN